MNYRPAYERSQNDWDWVTSASGGISDWDFNADLYADAFLSLYIYATSRCMSRLQLICRPIPSTIPYTSRTLIGVPYVAKHCYFLLTFPDGTKTTIGAYDFGDLTPRYNDGSDSQNPQNCISDDSDLGKPFCKDLPPSCETFRVLNDAVNRRPLTPYHKATNNSNMWVKDRCDALGINCMLPPSAPTNQTEFNMQKDRVLNLMLDAGYGTFSIGLVDTLF